MERIVADSAENFGRAVAMAVAALRRGGVIAAPTETVYGLMTLWGNTAGRERIFTLKKRAEDKPLQMLAANLGMAAAAGVGADPRLERLAARFWPGPLTVVCVGIRGSSIGLRIPQHAFIQALLQRLGKPLAATSANLSGEPAAADADAAVRNLAAEPELLVDGGPIRGAASSTVISIAGPEPELLRAGPISIEEVRAALTECGAGAAALRVRACSCPGDRARLPRTGCC